MKKILSGVFLCLCLLADLAAAQQASSAPTESSITLDIKVIDVTIRSNEEIEKLVLDKNRFQQMVADGKIKIAANVQIKTISGESNSVRIGQRVPWSRAESSQVNYENTGFNIEVQPKLLRENLIEVKLRIEMTAIIMDKNPTYVNRSITHSIRLKPNEPTLMMGFTQNESFWPVTVEPGKPANDKAQGNFFILLNAKLTN